MRKNQVEVLQIILPSSMIAFLQHQTLLDFCAKLSLREPGDCETWFEVPQKCLIIFICLLVTINSFEKVLVVIESESSEGMFVSEVFLIDILRLNGSHLQADAF